MKQASAAIPLTANARQTLQFTSGSERCEAWLYLPQGASASHRVPVIVMAHGLGAVKALRLPAFAERFCDAGYACLVFDYRYFGGSTGHPRELVDIPSQLGDWRAAVAFARSLPEVDPERVVVWGTSFGGGHAIVTAADDLRIVAAVAQCPFTDGLASALAINPITNLKLALMALRDQVSQWLGYEPIRIKNIGAPGEVALMTSADALPGKDALLAASGLTYIPHLIPARVGLQIPWYRPGWRTKDVRCPILFCACEKDSVAPTKATLRLAARAPRKEIKVYPDGHFEIYVGEAFERVVTDQLKFLTAHVPP